MHFVPWLKESVYLNFWEGLYLPYLTIWICRNSNSWHCSAFVLDSTAIGLIFTGSWEQAQPGQLTQTSQGDIRHHMTSCSVYKLRELAGEEGSLLRNGLSIRFRVVSNCIVHHSLYTFFYQYYCCYYFSPCVVLLNCPYLSPWGFAFFFRFSSPSHQRGKEWASSRVVLSCWLGLNHDT